MLTAFHLGNFKAFAGTQRIPIRPLTLIFGPNSGGKSSIIHGLVLAHEAHRTGNLDVTRTEVGGDSVDLGGFRQFVHRRDLGRTVEWVAELDAGSLDGRLAEMLAPARKLVVSVGMAMRQREADAGRFIVDAPPHTSYYELAVDGEPVLRASARGGEGLKLDTLAQDHPLFRRIAEALVLVGTTTDTVGDADRAALEQAISDMVPGLTLERGTFVPSGVAGMRRSDEPGLLPVSSGRRKEDLANAVEVYFPPLLNDLFSGVCAAVGKELARLHYLGPLRSYPPRHLAFSEDHDRNWFAGGGYAWDVLRTDSKVRAVVNEWLGSSERLQTPYELVVSNLVRVSDLEQPLAEYVRKTNEDFSGIWVGEELPEDHQAREVGHERYIGFDESSEPEWILSFIERSDIERMPDLFLRDKRTSTIVSHRDVGIGVSQVLPVLVSAYGSRERLIAIEQPEIHIHPGLQAELGDVFIQSALGENGNRFLLETHSEHLILRILRRIREHSEGALPEGMPKILPEHVQVLYVEPSADGSRVIEIPVTEDGEFGRSWPKGFFAERARELM